MSSCPMYCAKRRVSPEARGELLHEHGHEEGSKERCAAKCALQGSSQVMPGDAMHIVGGRAEADREVACNDIKQLLLVCIQAVLG